MFGLPESRLSPCHTGYLFLFGPQHQEDTRTRMAKQPVLYWSKEACCKGSDAWEFLVAINHLSKVSASNKRREVFAVVRPVDSLWFKTRPSSPINFNSNSVWRDLRPHCMSVI